jgi:hypothetical protein
MTRWIAGIAAALLFISGAVLALQSRAKAPELPPAPAPRMAAASTRLSPIPNAPEADARSKEEKRFARADKNEDGRITLAELVEPRRKAFSELDVNSDGKLSFEEWSVKTIDKFVSADADQNRILSPAEYATTAPKVRPKKPACACG